MTLETNSSKRNVLLNQRRLIVLAIGVASVASMSGCASLGLSSADQRDIVKQRATVQEFYRTAIELQVFGLPTEPQLQALAPLVSERLASLLREARQVQATELTRHGGTEPPLVQGALLVSLFEGATGLVTVQPAAAPNAWQATLVYRQGADAVQWEDRVLLVNQANADGTRWVVDDIEFGGQWDFARPGRLSELLQSLRGQTNSSRIDQVGIPGLDQLALG